MAVLLSTSVGDIVIDLHAESCPITCKNFLKLCKIKYYNNCLFHSVQKDFIAQTGDPTGTGRGGDSIYKFLYGDQARFFEDEINQRLKHDKVGVVAMASAGEGQNASQFYITLRDGLDYLDEKHTIFGEVAEGFETLTRINEAYVDDNHRPYKNIRIKHTSILDDPFDDPPELAELIPDRSPELKPEEGIDVRLEDDWVPLEELHDAEEVEKNVRSREAHTRAVVLEMVGDIPDAEVRPPDNVLFVCKLNPTTQDEDLEVIFQRFGKVISADIIRDHKTGDSLCYGFVEFEARESCEAAYFKMDNVLIDDRRIHVDFSQSVSKLWNRYHKFGAQDDKQAVDGLSQRPKYELKVTDGQRGGTGKRYEMVFDETETDKNDNAKKREDVSRSPRSRSQVEERQRSSRDERHDRHERSSDRDRGRKDERDRDRKDDRDRDRDRDKRRRRVDEWRERREDHHRERSYRDDDRKRSRR
ncbi:peptidyl-prolyl cis-trans isomerase CYP59 [Selaginella moellendorffii]|uniref:peptidyl-prolyl cis-trans isomerase CYP59 n=1 Tax=Selaginella moellendorffii TaxID=88036 RepID=UPI000D1C70D5|nr:peptidyl-prolyl cis-trans isomerase CYP59 [Selaginella moellendorffii]|eukprot:XP_002965848.2 peptidyl-prolyl cis-trans isomerase CYP59 [Selaginella moellendorffii]